VLRQQHGWLTGIDSGIRDVFSNKGRGIFILKS
jgi:hypothetical protein